MDLNANPAATLCRSFLAFFILLAILAVTIPCPGLAHHQSENAKSMQPAHMQTAACCASTPSLSSPALCCTVHPEQAQQAVATESLPALAEQTAPLAAPALPSGFTRNILPGRTPSPPPLLHPILRI